MTKYLILPMFSMVILSFAVAFAMLKARIGAVKGGKMSLSYFKTYNEAQVTEDVLKTQQHFANLFEVPVLFYAACLAAMQIEVPGTAIHIWAWGFVLARIAHAWIHVGSNKIRQRMRAFALSVTCMAAVWICVLVHLLRS